MSLWDNKDPVREELFSVERLEEHARSLAAAQAVNPVQARGHSLSRRLEDNGAVILDAYRNTVVAISEGRAITPASEWLVDNYHLVERYIREIHSDLPPGYYRQLPKLTDGPFGGYPRMFGLAWAFVAHTDSRFDSDMLLRYLQAYQTVQPLTIGELWAVSVTLRIVLIENLRRLAEYIVQHRRERAEADKLADRLLGVNGRHPSRWRTCFQPIVTGCFRKPSRYSLFIGCGIRIPGSHPRWTGSTGASPRRSSSPDAVVREVHRRQGASNVSVRNVITSLRLISDVDWRDLFEASSLVDGILAEGSSFPRHGFRHTQSLSQRHRAVGAGLRRRPKSRLPSVPCGSLQRRREKPPPFSMNGCRTPDTFCWRQVARPSNRNLVIVRPFAPGWHA